MKKGLLASSVFILMTMLVACSGDRNVTLSSEEFQTLVTEGFPSPQIVTVDLPATARATLYLQTPEVIFADSRKTVSWVISGEVDLDFAGKFSSGPMSLVLKGNSELNISPQEHAVFLDNVTISSRDISVQSELVQMMVLDGLADIVAKRLDNLLLFPVSEDTPLAALMSAKGVGYRIEPDAIVLTSLNGG
ncbi:hypothetical protein [Sansalvadorimonas verongulae]|uniref:hypothetical protein n=1 Tax=Sansalvadorimonas verongulae TaxID=2172824 RepID=UPI0012BBB576|nr:hypothetical protein [Sansalvadorimonas verongulae]MTI13680.1 hypothetical protein [Sansalvadorimonas verongulae]